MNRARGTSARVAMAAVTLLLVTTAWAVAPATAAPPTTEVRAQADPPTPPQEPPTDQMIVRLAAGETLDAAGLGADAGADVRLVRRMTDGAYVVKLGARRNPAAARALANAWTRRADVLSAEPDALMQPDLVPNDPSYTNQWHYKAPTVGNYGANLPAAWDITTGSTATTVAVIDTGQLNHADLAGKFLPGYDMIATTAYANDGGGRDSDPSDPGDWITSTEAAAGTFAGCQVRNSSWHGTHVAGTIGAATNNALGVAGVNWNTKIIAVRVLGKCGGFTSDIADGIRWAAGLAVSGVPTNPNPAKVLNMSLGGTGTCTSTYQNAINAATAAGSLVVVSAGNSNVDAANARPASCANVVTVAATGITGTKASYSNFGSTVEIAAPGGDTGGSILSTLNAGTTTPGADSYAYYNGTSMAAPHVAGVASLMLAVNPTLTPAQITAALQANVTAFPAGGSCTTSNCGTGILNAAAAVNAVADVTAPSVSCASPPVAWQGAEVSVACTASDGTGSGVVAGSASFSLATSVGAGNANANASTGTRSVCDVAGNCVTAGPVTGIKVDRKGQVISITSPAPGTEVLPGTVLTAGFSCADPDSGPGTCTGSTADGAALPTATPGQQTLTVNATDAVGNTAVATRTYRVLGATLTGRLTDIDTGLPVSGATVRLWPNGAPNFSVQTTTAGDGTYAFVDVPAGVHQVQTLKSGSYLTSWYQDATTRALSTNVTLVTGQTTVADDVMVLVPPADAAPPVIVCDPADGAWHADNVSVACTASDAPAQLRYAADASFSLSTSVPDGTETASAATGTRTVCDRASNCATAGPVPGNKVDRKAPSATISSPANGASFPAGASVAAAYTCSDSGSGVATCAGSAASGAPVDTATPGTKTFTVDVTDSVGNTASVQRTYTVVAPGTSGTVTDVTTGLPLAGTSVRLWRVGSNSITYTAVTNAAGQYTIDNVVAGSYDVQFARSGTHLSIWAPAARARGLGVPSVLGPGLRPTVDAALPQPATLGGTVTDAATGNPVAGATVRVLLTGTSTLRHTATTNASGVYSIAGVYPASYEIEVTQAAYRTTWAPNAPNRGSTVPVVVSAGTTPVQDVAMTTLGTWAVARGRVTDATTGLPVGNVNVRLWVVGTQDFLATTTDANGDYAIQFPEGDHQIQFARPSHVTKWWNASATRAGATVVTFLGGTTSTFDVAITKK